MLKAEELFKDALSWLQMKYSGYRFFVERDVVWTLQTQIMKAIRVSNSPYRVFNDYPMLPGERRSFSADLVILDSTEVVEMAAEFKYEPSHKRNDIPSRKFSVVTWGYDGIAKDMERVREFVDRGKAKVAYAVFIDEGGHFHQKHLAPPGSEWKDWGNEVWVLSSRVLKL